MLELTDLRKRYGDVVALDGCGFSVPRGHLVGFVGANGAGKTTTMRAALGSVALDRGRVCWDRRPVGAVHRLRFGYMPEERGLYPRMQAADQLVCFARLHGVDRAAAEVRAEAVLDRLGLGGRARASVEQLSYGNQQRVQLAAALVHEPCLLVLDEPFAGCGPGGTPAHHIPGSPRRSTDEWSRGVSTARSDTQPARTARDLLGERLARGEIDVDEYQQRRHATRPARLIGG